MSLPKSKYLPKLNYVFRVSVLSCAGDGKWVQRCTVKQSNECKSSPAQLAGNIAANYLRVDETGVQVEFLGLQEDTTRDLYKLKVGPDKPITECNPFVLTLCRVLSMPEGGVRRE